MHKPFSIAMLNYQRVILYTMTYNDEENDTGDSENDSSNSE